MTSTERKNFNALQKKCDDLEKNLKNMTDNKDIYYRQFQDCKNEINSVHAALDTLPGLPGKRHKVDEYNTVDLDINARLFSWIANQAFGNKIKEVKND